ncbi:MAG: hypothetical protein LBM77_12035 [Spirochaetaceae bacterium]|nr:hypothetical protein [Spirochaetaceae bacterium]
MPKTGKYKLEVWGAQGGGNTAAAYLPGGPGGYSRGTVSLNQGERLYVYVGQFGGNTLSTSGGFNGGGDSKTHAYPGGGGTDIRLVQTDTYTAAKRLIVAGGGGGGSHFGTVSGTSPYGYGGGTEGGSGGSTFYQLSITMTQATGGTQDSGGEGSIASDNMYGTGGAGSFGLGGNGDNINHEPETSNIFGGGGGGGWYGGGGGSAGNYIVAGGGGGSGYVFTSTSKANYPAGAAIPADRYFLTDPALLSGNEQIPDPHDPTGTTEVPGNTGHGYARIRWVGP